MVTSTNHHAGKIDKMLKIWRMYFKCSRRYSKIKLSNKEAMGRLICNKLKKEE